MGYLTQKKQEEIENAVNLIYLKTGKSYPEDSLLDIAKEMGLEVRVADFNKLGEGYEGVCGVVDPEQKTIYVQNQNPGRNNFTLAHEIGHYVLGHVGKKFRIDKYNYDDSEDSMQEIEANFFAATLLMPIDTIKELKLLRFPIFAMAEYFGVSETAMRNRLRWLRTKT